MAEENKNKIDQEKSSRPVDAIAPPKSGGYFDLPVDIFEGTGKASPESSSPKVVRTPVGGSGLQDEIARARLSPTPTADAAQAKGVSPVSAEKAKGEVKKEKKGFFASLLKPSLSKEELAKKKDEERKKQEAIKREEEAKKTYEKGLASIRDLISPSSVQITPNYIVLNDFYIRTLFIFNYPRYIFPNWLSPLINLDMMLDIGMFIEPKENKGVLETLRKRSGQVESALAIEAQKGLVRNPELEAALQDIEELRDRLARGEERLFHFSIYITLYSKDLEELDLATKKVESMLGGSLIYTKRAGFQMDQGFRSTIPLGSDLLDIKRNMNTGALSTTFPFASMNLTSDQGIMYGINRHNNSLIIFDRFSLENANSVIFAKSGGGKSYAVKLEILRYMMFGTDVMVVDPEDEYKNLCRVVGGTYFSMSLSSNDRINPFDLHPLPDDANDEMGEDNLRDFLINEIKDGKPIYDKNGKEIDYD